MLDPRLLTRGGAEFSVMLKDQPVFQVKAGVPLDKALEQVGLLVDFANTLAKVIANQPEAEQQNGNLAFTIGLLSDMATSILSDVESPVRQLCQGDQP